MMSLKCIVVHHWEYIGGRVDESEFLIIDDRTEYSIIEMPT